MASLLAQYRAYVERASAESQEYLALAAERIAARMRSEAPWNNRTGEARDTLYCEPLSSAVAGGQRRFGLQAGSLAPHAIFLETKRYTRDRRVGPSPADPDQALRGGPVGTDAVILPTMREEAPGIVDDLAAIWGHTPTGRAARVALDVETPITVGGYRLRRRGDR